MFKILRKISSKIILSLIEPQALASIIIKETTKAAIENSESQVTLGNGSRFFLDTKVYNLQNNSKNIIIGKNTNIKGHLLLFKFGGSIKIGDNCFVGEGTRIWSAESIVIGNNVLISHSVGIVDTNSHEIDAVERAERYAEMINEGHWNEKGNVLTSPIVIKDYAWINFNSIILKGVTIGEGAIVAAGSVVTKDVPDYVVVAGNPARIVRYLRESKEDIN